MNKLSRFSLASLASLAVLGAPGALLFACATDNGDSVHGPQFGAVPERPDGSSAEGAVLDDGGLVTSDAEAGEDAPADDGALPACTAGTVAVLAGNDTSLSGAVRIKGGAWAGAPITGGAAKSAPSLVAFGTGFLGLTRGPGDALQSVTYGTSWSGATQVGSLVTASTPALTVMGAKAQSVYRSAGADTNLFSRLENAGAAWSTSPDPVMKSGSAQAFGLAAATIAAVGTELVFAQDGTNEGLYVQAWDGASWGASAPITGAGTIATSSPALVAISGKFDLVLLYPDNTTNHVIGFATRDATTKVWSTGQVTQPTAQTAEPMSVAKLSATSLLVAFRGNDGRPYTMLGTIGASAIAWGLPAPLLADTSMVDSAPAVAPGVCGNDAIAVFASGGIVKATEHRGTAWSVPGTVTGAAGARVSVATR